MAEILQQTVADIDTAADPGRERSSTGGQARLRPAQARDERAGRFRFRQAVVQCAQAARRATQAARDGHCIARLRRVPAERQGLLVGVQLRAAAQGNGDEHRFRAHDIAAGDNDAVRLARFGDAAVQLVHLFHVSAARQP